MKFLLFILLFFSFVLAQKPAVQVVEGWVRLPPPILKSSVAYMVLQNLSDRPLRLIGGSTNMTSKVIVMSDYVEVRNGVKLEGMREVPYLELPAKGRLELAPSGKHLMLMGLKRPLNEGEAIELTLHFQGGTTFKVSLKVQNK